MSRFKALLLSAGVACLLPFSSPAAAQCPATVPAANGAAPRPAAAVSLRQLVERRHLRGAGGPRLGELHRVHQQRRHAPAASGLRRRGVARQRRHLRNAVRHRRRLAAQAGRDVRRTGTRATASIHATGQGVPFYPIPPQAITQPHWVEGGAPGNVDQRDASDRHLLIVDCTNRYLYELYNVYYNTAQGEVVRGIGRVLRHERRTTGGRTDGRRRMPRASRSSPVSSATTRRGIGAITDIGHAFRVTVRSDQRLRLSRVASRRHRRRARCRWARGCA